MAFDTKFGSVDLEHGSIGEDEPVFVLRAKDKFALGTISDYEQRVRAAIEAEEITQEDANDLLEDLCQARAAFERFATDNPEDMKYPD